MRINDFKALIRTNECSSFVDRINAGTASESSGVTVPSAYMAFRRTCADSSDKHSTNKRMLSLSNSPISPKASIVLALSYQSPENFTISSSPETLDLPIELTAVAIFKRAISERSFCNASINLPTASPPI